MSTSTPTMAGMGMFLCSVAVTFEPPRFLSLSTYSARRP
jgi:hypothetical protein